MEWSKPRLLRRIAELEKVRGTCPSTARLAQGSWVSEGRGARGSAHGHSAIARPRSGQTEGHAVPAPLRQGGHRHPRALPNPASCVRLGYSLPVSSQTGILTSV